MRDRLLRLPGDTWLASRTAPRATGIAQHDMGIVVEAAAGHGGGEIGGDLGDIQAGDELREVIGMDADIGEAGRLAGARRIGAPFRLLLAVGIDRQRQPVLDIGGMDDAQPPSSPPATISRAWRTMA